MKTPIVDFVKKYNESDFSRLHMPGHKGKSFLGCEPFDITEIDGADVLYSAEGIIAESETNATQLFASGHTFYSAEGSSLSIKAMLALVGENGERPLILAARNVHKAFVYACALLDYDVEWIYSKSSEHLCSCKVSAQEVEQAIISCKKKPSAVYLTSPDYLGTVADIREIAEVCKANGIPLLVDNAHGAYLAFLSSSLHPLALGAAMCCDSAHKTFPVLTGGAYLHISSDYPQYIDRARNKLSLFASTSPSYLILQSLDLCNAYLADGYKDKLCACIDSINRIKAYIAEKGFCCIESDPLKITVNAPLSGYTGAGLAAALREYGIEAEFADGEYLVLMLTPENAVKDFERLKTAFDNIRPKTSFIPESTALKEPLKAVMTVREGVFASSEKVPIENAVGRICASPCVSCPPAVPIAVSGEIITKEAADLFRNYGIFETEVVK